MFPGGHLGGLQAEIQSAAGKQSRWQRNTDHIIDKEMENSWLGEEARSWLTDGKQVCTCRETHSPCIPIAARPVVFSVLQRTLDSSRRHHRGNKKEPKEQTTWKDGGGEASPNILHRLVGVSASLAVMFRQFLFTDYRCFVSMNAFKSDTSHVHACVCACIQW